ncbi:MAG: hypothetical protein ABIG37_01085 [Nanoarchaeota archaeon]|nr:hypothetical protein [Nanoarchaeota archaeon]
MHQIITGIIFGIIGALMRVAITTYRHVFYYKEKMNKKSFIIYLAATLIIGSFVGIIFSFKPIIATLGGYAGNDLVGTFKKAFKKKKFKVN